VSCVSNPVFVFVVSRVVLVFISVSKTSSFGVGGVVSSCIVFVILGQLASFFLFLKLTRFCNGTGRYLVDFKIRF
jgi:hypothetical protein